MNAGATLTIEPGVIVKFNGQLRQVTIKGSLNAVGSGGSRIVFTSIKDDVGGDDGGDGGTAPAAGDWRNIWVSDGTATLDHVDVRYGGYDCCGPSSSYGVLHARGASVSVDHSTFERNRHSGILLSASANWAHATVERSDVSRNGGGISVIGGRLEIARSNVSDNSARGIFFSLTSTYADAASTVTETDVARNGDLGVYLQVASDLPSARWPRGTRNNVFDNKPTQHPSQAGPDLAALYTRSDVDWTGNFWGGDAYWRYNPSQCGSIAPHSLGWVADLSNTANAPYGPVPRGHYIYDDPVNNSLDTLCYFSYFMMDDPFDFSRFYLPHEGPSAGGGGLGGPGMPWEQALGWCGGGLHAMNTSECLSDPVNGLTGNFVDATTDLSLPGVGVPFEFVRTYNSLDPSDGPLGVGWTHSYAASLSVAANGDVKLRGEDGQRVAYRKQADGSFALPPGGRSRLTQTADGYELLRHDQVRYAFNGQGRLLSVRDRNGQGVTLSYATDGKLERITDSAGREISLSYNADGLLSRVALPDGRNTSYGYANRKLTSVVDARGKTWAFAYQGAGFLQSKTDPNAHRVYHNTYASSGRVTEQLDATSKKTVFAWDNTMQTATTTDARNNVWKDFYEGGKLIKRVDPLGNTTRYGYDADLNRTSATPRPTWATAMTPTATTPR